MIGAGIVLELSLILLRHFCGYSHGLFVLWVVAIGLSGFPFFLKRVRGYPALLTKEDVLPISLLVGIGIALYTFSLNWFPIQMAVDEVVTLSETRDVFSQPRDLLGPSHYHDYPNMGYVCFGYMAKLLGGLSITTLREANAYLGVVTLVALYLFYRVCCQRFVALGAACVAGYCHSLVGLSKIGIRGNVDVLVEVIAYSILIRAAKLRCQFLAFVGGAAAGGAYYFYYPARSSIIIWGLVNALVAAFSDKVGRRAIAQLYAISFLAFMMTAAPEMIASAERADPYLKQQLLFTKEGIAQQMDRESTDNPMRAYINNVSNSLTAFNTAKSDHWGNYWNPGHGFVEPITGAFLWIGLLSLIRLKKREEEVNWVATVCLVGFSFLLFLYTFVIGNAPAYTRLIILLPFIGFLVVNGGLVFSKIINRALAKSNLSIRLSAHLVVAVIVILSFINNLQILSVWLESGLKDGERFGATIRYVEERRDQPGYKFYIVTPSKASPAASFLTWKTATDCEFLLRVVAPNREIHAIEPNVFCSEIGKGLICGQPLRPPLTVFVTKSITPCLEDFVRAYPQMKMHPMLPNYEYEALEIER
jgi:hypothetical protein